MLIALFAVGGFPLFRVVRAGKPTAAQPTSRVILVQDDRGKVIRAYSLTDKDQVAAIESFFPGYHDRPTSDRAGAWRSGYQVYFDFPDCHSDRLLVSSPSLDMAVWSIGNGDHAVKGDIHKFVAGLDTHNTGASASMIWAVPQNGLTGRLLVTHEDLKPGRRHVVSVELRNDSTERLTVIDQPRLKVELTTAGKPVPPSFAHGDERSDP